MQRYLILGVFGIALIVLCGWWLLRGNGDNGPAEGKPSGSETASQEIIGEVMYGGLPLEFPDTLLLLPAESVRVNELLLTWLDDFDLHPAGDLRSFSVPESGVVDLHDYAPSPDLAGALSREGDVRWLRVRTNSDQGLSWLGKMEELKGLAVQSSLSNLGTFPELKELRWLLLSLVPDGEKPVKGLPGLPGLEVLTYAGNYNIEDRDLPAQGQCPRLRALGTGFFAKITDKGLADLVSACPRLEHLNLANNKGLTSDAIASLKKLKYLRYVHVGGTGIDATRLQQAMPDCEVSSVN